MTLGPFGWSSKPLLTSSQTYFPNAPHALCHPESRSICHMWRPTSSSTPAFFAHSPPPPPRQSMLGAISHSCILPLTRSSQCSFRTGSVMQMPTTLPGSPGCRYWNAKLGQAFTHDARTESGSGEGYIWESAPNTSSIELEDNGCRTGVSARDGIDTE